MTGCSLTKKRTSALATKQRVQKYIKTLRGSTYLIPMRTEVAKKLCQNNTRHAQTCHVSSGLNEPNPYKIKKVASVG